jgi:chaperonin GroEL
MTNPERMEAVLENAYFLITDKSITNFTELIPFLEEFVKLSKNLVVISPEIGGEAFPSFVQNKIQGKIFSLCIQAPSFGEDQKNILQDIATLTDGKFLSKDAGFDLSKLTTDDLGFAESITATKNASIIVGGRGSKKEIALRVASIKKAMEDADLSDFDKERMKARIGKLTNGVAVIRGGGQTEVEMKERRERVLDSVGATKAAMQGGIVPGGEIVYLHIRKALRPAVKDQPWKPMEMNQTEKVLFNALYKPFQKLITNAGLSEVDMALALNGKGKDFGIDVTTGEVKDMIKAGIVDPSLVGINALKNACSVAVSIITTDNVIVRDAEDMARREVK